jgi:3D (Asp-Asp-Asp) domain-containing protein
MTWLSLLNGSHTITITASDVNGNSASRIYIFNKNINSFTIQNSTPLSASVRPTRIKMVVTRNIPAGATFKVYVCNNGFDETPTWEDATSSVTGGLVHVFANTIKTAENWGVLIKVEVNRGSAEGACFVSQIGGNFE